MTSRAMCLHTVVRTTVMMMVLNQSDSQVRTLCTGGEEVFWICLVDVGVVWVS